MISDGQNYVIGVDGGGTKTVAALADFRGRILAQAKSGPSNPIKVGRERAIANLVEVIEKVSRKEQKNRIALIYIALAGCLERDKKRKREIRKSLLSQPKLSWLSSDSLVVERDQLAAFRSGTNQKDGVLLIAGTGSIVIGWQKGKEVIAGGREHLLGDAGGGFWVGQKALRYICCSLDGLVPKTLLSELVLKKLKIKNEGDLIRKIYQPKVVETVASVASLVDIAAKKGDKIAKKILIEAAQELAVPANHVIRKLNFKNKRFPLVLAGGVFESKVVLNKVKTEIKKRAPHVKFIRPKEKAVKGAVKLAIERL